MHRSRATFPRTEHAPRSGARRATAVAIDTPAPTPTTTRLLWLPGLAFAALLALLLGLLSPLSARAAEFPPPPEPSSPGVWVVDQAGLLTEQEIATLQQRAAAVADAGAPVVVYLQLKDAGEDETEEDAGQLMEEWDVQSAPDARDGIVILLNLDPENPRRGELRLVAGAAHFDGGNLPQRELNRISDAMLDELRDERTAEGIGVGLDMLASSLVNGPPPDKPSGAEQFADDAVGGPLSPLNIAGFATALAVVGGAIAYAQRRLLPQPAKLPPVTTPPSQLPPAIGGALATGKVGSEATLATMLDLASRGVLAIEAEDPDGGKRWWSSGSKARVNLHNVRPELLRTPHEEAIIEALRKSDDGDGYVHPKELAKARKDLDATYALVTADLVERGYWDTSRASQRAPLYIVATIIALAAFVVFIIAAIGESFWGMGAAAALFTAAVITTCYGFMIRDLTPAGEQEAARWRAFAKGLKQVAKQADVNLDRDFPWAVALGVATDFDKPLRKASKEGYAAAWLGPTTQGYTATDAVTTYIIWSSLTTSVAPSYSGSSAGAGASAGSGSAGGSF